MKGTKAEMEWIEQFYSDLEKRLTKYKRPDDYVERALRILTNSRKEVSSNATKKD